MSRGIIAISIEEGDELVAASLTDGHQIVFLASHDGQAIRFDENDVRSMGRNAAGVRGMNLEEERLHRRHGHHDQAGGRGRSKRRRASLRHADVDVCRKRLAHSLGYRKWIRQTHSRRRISPARRGGYGVINVKTTERNGKVVGISQVTEKSEVMLISQYGKIIRIESKLIRESGRSAQGVRLLNMEAGGSGGGGGGDSARRRADGWNGTLIQ